MTKNENEETNSVKPNSPELVDSPELIDGHEPASSAESESVSSADQIEPPVPNNIKGSRHVAIFGASSAVAQALARLHAARGDSLILLARSDEKLSIMQADLEARGAASVRSIKADLAITEHHDELMVEVTRDGLELDRYYFAYGVLPDQKACEQSATDTLQALNTNFLSVVSLLTRIANVIEVQKNKTLVVISSVAGDRGRQSNYVYGCGKGGLSLFMQGLRNRLNAAQCVVLNVKPGFIDTPMTADIKKGGPLWATPNKVAEDIINAADKGRNEIYTPWFWGYIMLIIRSIPEFIFKKLKL